MTDLSRRLQELEAGLLEAVGRYDQARAKKDWIAALNHLDRAQDRLVRILEIHHLLDDLKEVH